MENLQLLGETAEGVVLSLPDNGYTADRLANISDIGNGNAGYGVIVAKSGSSLVLENVTIKLAPEKVRSGINGLQFAGIVTEDADIKLNNVTIDSIRSTDDQIGNQTGYAILSTDGNKNIKNTISIVDSKFTNFQKGAIYLSVRESSASTDNITITGNTIEGIGESIIAQNGIVINTNGEITISKNTISNLKCNNNADAYGILVYGKYTNDNVNADKFAEKLAAQNTITNCDADVYIEGQVLIENEEELTNALTNITADKPTVLRLKSNETPYEALVKIPQNADVTIIGESKESTIITLPDTAYTTSSDNFEFGKNNAYGIILADDGAKVTIKNVTIKANPANFNDASGLPWKRFAAIVAKNSDIYLENVAISDIKCTDDLLGMSNFGYGLLTIDSTDVVNNIVIKDCTFTNYQKAAIYIGVLNDTPSTDAITITGTTITGMGSQGIIGQNGIYIYSSGSLNISGNTISEMIYNPNPTNEWANCSLGIAVEGKATTDAEAESIKTTLEENNIFKDVDTNVDVYTIE